MIVEDGLELLTAEDAAELLARGHVGRVGISVGALPAILPVSYLVMDGAIYFRTSEGSKLAAATAGAVVAFEVDEYDLGAGTGWSVLAVGQGEVVHDLGVTFRVLDAGLESMAGGRRTSLVRIQPRFLSGRRIVRDERA
jgi:nitroimidazol reductase NimA-like FMN-containing flavoprotein (pyridoxamine 5'-phosphate oxidase superfamily)